MTSYTMICAIFLPLIVSILADKVNNASKTDLTKCKISQMGTEYRGTIAKTISNVRCQAWNVEEPINEISASIKDNDFPEKSMRDAKNYCRNPTRDIKGPWCYSMDADLVDDQCDVPLCNFGECRLSGPGAEYGGRRKISSSNRKCKSWHKRHKLIDSKSPKYENKQFPEGSLKKANSFCRNPTDDVGGPWCYVEQDNFEFVEKEYCDIPFCDDKGFLDDLAIHDCISYAKSTLTYTTLTELNPTDGNISFSIKLWDPNNERDGEVRILLSVLPIPSSGEIIADKWGAGVELLFSNAGTRQTFPSYNEDENFESTPQILLSTKWTGLWITWAGGFISLGMLGTTKPLYMQEYKKKGGITELYPDEFRYYGIQGTGVLWTTGFCQNHCEVHTTFGTEFSRVWSLEKSNDTFDVRYYVRASQDIHVRLYQTPAQEYPSFTVVIGRDITSLIYQESETAMKRYLKDVSTRGLLDFWTWTKFSISIFGQHLRLFAQQVYGNVELLYANQDLFATLRWFSIGSEKTLAHWTVFCSPEEADAVEAPWPPNCISDLKDYGYAGSQWTSQNEIPCVPWISKEVSHLDKDDSKFVDGSALKALNKCRNPNHDPNGIYCYALLPWERMNISKRYCQIRNCRSSECRMAGTANDYVGKLSKTRSGRACDKWPTGPVFRNVTIKTSTSPTTTKRTRRPLLKYPKHRPISQQDLLFQYIPPTSTSPKPKVITKIDRRLDREFFNDTLYPEGSAKNASNFCRNPSRNIAGTWCYTTDPMIPQDLCNVRDCEKPATDDNVLEEYTFLVRGDGTGRRLYVLPEYRSEGLRFSLKAWEPDQPDSITFVFIADDGFESRYVLKIGALDNEKVLLYYRSEHEAIELVKKKTLPHLLYLGKWSSFIIRIPRGQVLLYYEGAPDPLFEWTHPNPTNAFLPVYYYYGSEKGRTIGVAFDRDSTCHIENTRTNRYSRILPLSMWSEKELPAPEKVTFLLRGKGVISIPLLLLPATPGFYALTFDEPHHWIIFTRSTYPNTTIFHRQMVAKPLFVVQWWTNITIRWSGNTIDVWCNATNVLHYQHLSPLYFYFFSLGVDPGGWATWTVNCIPIDIDGEPVDGGWSEWGAWACSASCNGGTGTRKRLCESPKPNVKGEPCIGPRTMIGRCNEITCGDITDDTETLIKRRIRGNHTALTVVESHTVTIYSDPDVVHLITEQSARAVLEWSVNGVFVREEEDRISIKDYNIEIRRARLNDSGVYAMTLHRVDETYSIIKVVSLAVFPMKENILIRETQSMTVTCHCTVLGHVYSDLQVYWMVEDTILKDYGITVPLAVNSEYVYKVNKSHHGLWRCVVKQNDLNFEWITNAILVKGAPNWRTYLMEDEATRYIFGWLPSEDIVGVFALIIFLISVTCIVIGSIYFIRFRESLKRTVPSPQNRGNS